MNTKIAIKTYKNAISSYSQNMEHLKEMQNILMEINRECSTVKDIDDALDLCRQCIYRMKIVLKSLTTGDVRYLDGQMSIVKNLTNDFMTITNKINHDVIALRIMYSLSLR